MSVGPYPIEKEIGDLLAAEQWHADVSYALGDKVGKLLTAALASDTGLDEHAVLAARDARLAELRAALPPEPARADGPVGDDAEHVHA